ncbi:MAG: hypothetical protein ACLUNO_01155 [Oscillospiraceae bacterium]
MVPSAAALCPPFAARARAAQGRPAQSSNTIWPVPEKEIRAACANAKRVIVAEMNVGDYAREVQRVVGYDKVETFSSIGGVFPAPTAIYNQIVEGEVI